MTTNELSTAATELLDKLAPPTCNDELVLKGILQHVASLPPTQEPVERPQSAGVVGIKKTDHDLQIVWSEVYVPMVPDTHGDFMRAEEIRKMAYNFLANNRNHSIDINHDQKEDDHDHVIVESFIARKGDPIFAEGGWVLGVHIPDPEVWADVKSGKLNGFSMDALVKKQVVIVSIEVDPLVEGHTAEVNDHVHKFMVRFNNKGEFLGGETTNDEGHVHLIRRETLTEKSDGHAHRFSVVGEVDAVA